ncbi:MAG: chemotaxis response regulator protein-glutamate methylesterase [Nitrospinaceae bacterium]|nr:MAG: chemotaxis response regulator protein-glutamate methylesterase [Nitrospinaceae bacterium]
MTKIRVLVVDDSVVVRKIVTDSLATDPEIDVVGVAANGRIALAKIPQINPDILTLDIEMPEMDGLQTLAEVRKIYPTLPVIMFSTLTERGGAKTLEALALGATDYVTKPANVGSVSVAMQRVRDELIPKIKIFCAEKAGLQSPPGGKPSSETPVKPKIKSTVKPGLAKPSTAKIDIVAIGVSTGGPNALAELFPVFPKDFPVPIVMVQHMPPFFTKLLAERLTAKSEVPVTEGSSGQILENGKAWIAPGDYHMVLEKNGTKCKVQTNQNQPENSCRPAVDVLFRSVVKVYGSNILGVILTGMGQDGLVGCEHIKDAGGRVIVQDEGSSVVWGMPGFVAKAGLADKILPLNQIGKEIIKIAKVGR